MWFIEPAERDHRPPPKDTAGRWGGCSVESERAKRNVVWTGRGAAFVGRLGGSTWWGGDTDQNTETTTRIEQSKQNPPLNTNQQCPNML